MNTIHTYRTDPTTIVPSSPRDAGSSDPSRAGAELSIRPLGPDDGKRIADSIERLSPRSRLMRFAAPMPRIPERLLRHLCSVDGRDHIAWGVFCRDRLIAVGRFVRFAGDRAAADVAIEVADDWQRHGLGPRLLALLATSAEGLGVERFSFTVSGDNRPAQKMLARFGVVLRYAGGLGEGWLPIAELVDCGETLQRAAA